MKRYQAIHYHPEKLIWIGLSFLFLITLIGIVFIFPLNKEVSSGPVVVRKHKVVEEKAPISFDLRLKEDAIGIVLPKLEGEMTFAVDPPRPGLDGDQLFIRLKSSKMSQKIKLPCRLDLEFQGNRIVFTNRKSLFWVDLNLLESSQVEGKAFITTPEGNTLDTGKFIAPVQDKPIQDKSEVQNNLPFKILAESRWWGPDLLKPKETALERLEIAEEDVIELSLKDWLVFHEGKWQKSNTYHSEHPIAKVESVEKDALILEGWGEDGHIRLSIQREKVPTSLMKAEDLFSSLRVRSEKQISCKLEKQCMLLKPSDYVLKMEGRWKILRKKEEKQAVLDGNLYGELFILDEIIQSRSQKMIKGRLFNAGRTEMIPIHVKAQTLKTPRKPLGKK